MLNQLSPDGDQPADAAPGTSTWGPADIEPVLDGTWRPAEPTVGRCHSAPGLLYPGKRHDVYAETEAGKTWLALRVVLDVLTAGASAVFVDFEDDAGGVVGRLLAMDAPVGALRSRFAYIRPEQPITTVLAQQAVKQVLGDLRPALVVLDGRTEGMALHGLDPLVNLDVAVYGQLVERRFMEAGAAVLALDHVVKVREQRGRYGLGAGHKLNGLDGAAFLVENRQPFGVGEVGRSTVRVGKDRPGQLRRFGLPGKDGTAWLGDLVVDATQPGYVDVALAAPSGTPSSVRPTVLMDRVARALADSGGDPLSMKKITDRVQGKDADIRAAVECLIEEGFVTTRDGPRGARLHVLARPFA